VAVVLLALAGALLAGRLAGGRFAQLGNLRLRRPWLVPAAVAAQLAGALVPAGPAYPIGLALSAVLAGAFLGRNRRVAGLGLVALGLAANAVAVAGNGGRMPVSLAALARTGGDGASLLGDRRHEVASTATHVRPLTDVVPAPLPFGLGQVLSVGDVLVASGCALLVFTAVRGCGHGQEGAQAPRTQEQQGEPREAPERLTSAARAARG